MSEAAAPETQAPKPLTVSRLVRSLKPVQPDETNRAGVYRCIHGGISIVNPAWISDKETPHTPKQIRVGIHAIRNEVGTVTGYVGDEVELCHEDAVRLLALDKPEADRHLHAMVEPLDAKPSRVGKVLVVPKETRNWAVAPTRA